MPTKAASKKRRKPKTGLIIIEAEPETPKPAPSAISFTDRYQDHKAVDEYRENVAPKLGGGDLFEIAIQIPDEITSGGISCCSAARIFTVSGPRGTVERVAEKLVEFLSDLAGDANAVTIPLVGEADGAGIGSDDESPDAFTFSVQSKTETHERSVLLSDKDGSRNAAMKAINLLAAAFNHKYAVGQVEGGAP